MATTTPRIGLTKPDGTDLVDIAVLNTNFDKIDSNIASTKIQATKPTTANAGDLWWDSDTGTLYLYYVDANSSQWVAATSDPINIGVVANQTERDAQYPTPAQGMSVYRTDLGVTQRYYGLFNSSTNPGGRDTAGWYDTEKNIGLVQVKPTTLTAVTGTASLDAMGTISFSGCTQINLDGVHTTKYRNYRVIVRANTTGGSTGYSLYYKLRNAGAPDSAPNYCRNGVYMNGSTLSAIPTTSSSQVDMGVSAGNTYTELTVSYPMVADVTGIFTDQFAYTGGVNYGQLSRGHNQNNNLYDGFQIAVGGSGTISGTIQVFGFND